MVTKSRQKVGIIGSGAAGLSAAWLLNHVHEVTLLEHENRLGGHAHTAWIDSVTNKLVTQDQLPHSGILPEGVADNLAGSNAMNHDHGVDNLTAIDTGFIVFNHHTYPNFCAWLDALGISSEESDMSFAVSRDGGGFEYAGGIRGGLTAQPANLLKLRFWRMLIDLVRFYRNASSVDTIDDRLTLGQFLRDGDYNQPFIRDHLLPFGAAIWSTSQAKMLDYPVGAFIRFCQNHSLLKLSGRPKWRTVTGGSASYVNAVGRALGANRIRCDFSVESVERSTEGVKVRSAAGESLEFDQVVFACHADQALAMLAQPDAAEQSLLGAFRYDENLAYLHTDKRFLPKRRAAWASWNYIEHGEPDLEAKPGVNYWMNQLQNLTGDTDYIVSLNPSIEPSPELVLRSTTYTHPIFNAETYQSQQSLWQLQGINRSWFCGSYFGSGFHEDAIQSGFAVAEQLGGISRPWSVEGESARIFVNRSPLSSANPSTNQVADPVGAEVTSRDKTPA